MSPVEPPKGWTRRSVLALVQALIATPLLGRDAAAQPMPRPAGLVYDWRVFEPEVFKPGVFE
jgi:hypothetical protein